MDSHNNKEKEKNGYLSITSAQQCWHQLSKKKKSKISFYSTREEMFTSEPLNKPIKRHNNFDHLEKKTYRIIKIWYTQFLLLRKI
jgi:alpha-acetolactate decarboxylase